MKKLFRNFLWSTLCALGLFSCTEKDVIEVPVDPEPNYEIDVDYDAIAPTNFIEVPAKDGYITFVTQGTDTLIATREATVLEVLNPQYSILTRRTTAKPICSYVAEQDDFAWNTADYEYGWTMYKTMMFEDVKGNSSDFDYNDLVVHVQQKRKGNKLRIYIHPIAMGNTINIQLGADILLVNSQGKGEKCAEIIFSENVKKDLFGVDDQAQFINTYQIDRGYPAYFVKPRSFTSVAKFDAKYEGHWLEVKKDFLVFKTFGINWFIINAKGEKIYAVPAVKDNIEWRHESGRPYGIVSGKTRLTNWPLSDTDQAGHDWINYPKEKINIKKVYPDFDDWLAGKANANWDNPNDGTFINAIGYVRGILTPVTDPLYDIHYWMPTWNHGEPTYIETK